jgi:hypothetical protein
MNANFCHHVKRGKQSHRGVGAQRGQPSLRFLTPEFRILNSLQIYHDGILADMQKNR